MNFSVIARKFAKFSWQSIYRMRLKITALSLRDSARNRGAHCVAICPHLQIHNFGLFSRFHYKGYFMQDYGLLRLCLAMTKWENFKYAGLWIATLAFAMTEDKTQDKRARIGLLSLNNANFSYSKNICPELLPQKAQIDGEILPLRVAFF